MDSRWIKVDYILILQGTVMEKYVYQFSIYACCITLRSLRMKQLNDIEILPLNAMTYKILFQNCKIFPALPIYP